MPKNYKDSTVTRNDPGALRELILTAVSRDRVSPYEVDFRRWLYIGRPTSAEIEASSSRSQLQLAGRNQLVSALYEISVQVSQEVLGHSLSEYLRTGIRVFFEFIDELSISGSPNVTAVSDIDRTLMIKFIEYLKRQRTQKGGGTLSPISANSIYKSAVNILRRFVDKGILARDVFPSNPFPGAVNAVKKHNVPYSSSEMKCILVALRKDLTNIRAGKFPVKSANYVIGVYFALIAAYTGINTTSLAELTLSGIQQNPLGDNWILLTTVKRRKPDGKKVERRTIGNAMPTQTAFPQAANNARPLPIDRTVHRLLIEIIALSQEARELAPEELKSYVFIYVDRSARGAGKIQRFEKYISRSMGSIVVRHELRDDRGAPMVLRVSRFRVTEADRIFHETGDIHRTAAALNNSPRVYGSHYVPVTTHMERTFAFVGLALEAFGRRRTNDDAYIDRLATETGLDRPDAAKLLQGHWNTGVARCSDPLTGRFAPRNGSPCTKFLHCFRCPNMVVLGHPDDLYRLFSFYYFLVHERLRLGGKAWKRAYRHVIYIIDELIAPKFPKQLVADARKRAQESPHRMWAWKHYEMTR
jgi:hypothetical protein